MHPVEEHRGQPWVSASSMLLMPLVWNSSIRLDQLAVLFSSGIPSGCYHALEFYEGSVTQTLVLMLALLAHCCTSIEPNNSHLEVFSCACLEMVIVGELVDCGMACVMAFSPECAATPYHLFYETLP